MKHRISAAVASLSALSFGAAHSAMGQTTINNVGVTVGAGQVYDMNLNGDGTTNFAIRFDGKSSTDTTTWNQFQSPFVSARPQDTTAATQTTYVLGVSDASQGGTQGADVAGFPLVGPGASIGPGYQSPFTIGYLYQDYNSITVGGWSPTSISDGYVGLELTSNSGSVTNYGWVEITFNYNGGNNSTITVLRTAYDATPNEPLITPALSVPEPTVLALAGMAGAMLVSRRKLRRM